MSEHIKSQLKGMFNDARDAIYKLWAFQLIDESTDIGAFVFEIHKRWKSCERIPFYEYFFCRELHSTTTGEDIFELGNDCVDIF